MTMGFDLLFEGTEKTMTSEAMDDFMFHELQATVFAGKSDLYNCFIKVVSSPLTDRNAIMKRQAILQDLLASPHLIDSMCEICRKAKDTQVESRKNLYQKIDAKMRLQINYQTAQRIFDYIDAFGDLTRSCRFRSADLNRVKNYFGQTDKFLLLRNGLSALTRRMLDLSIYSGEIEFNELVAFKTMKIRNFDSGDLSNESVNVKRVRLFQKRSSDNADLKIDYSETKDIERQIEQITEKATYDVCRILAGVYTYFKSLFRSLYEQLSFYQSALLYLGYLQRNGQVCCFPEITCESNFIEASRLYFLPLALKNGIIDTNEFCTLTDSVFVITGYNRGGKTTFLRSIGFAQISAQAGLMVPARSYKCSVFRYILVHFPRGEGKQLSAGLFEDEMKRLKSDTDYVKDHALVLLNESFSTTVEAEAELLASDIITAFAQTNSLVFFVTHFYRFAVHIEDLNNRLDGKAVAVNLVTKKYEKPNARTDYQIVRGDPIPNYKIRLEDFI